MGGTLALRSDDGTAGSGGTVMFGADQGFFAAIKGTLTDGEGNTSGELRFYTRNPPSSSTMQCNMTMNRSGNVGIGTTEPGTLLTFYKDYPVPAHGSEPADDTTQGITFRSKLNSYAGSPAPSWTTPTVIDTAKIWFQPRSYINISGSAGVHGYLAFGTGYAGSQSRTPDMVINTSGNVGIGTTYPYFKTDINYDGTVDINYGLKIHNKYNNGSSNRMNTILFTDSNSTQGAIGGYRESFNNHYLGGLVFYTGSQPPGYIEAAPSSTAQATASLTEAMRIKPNGNVGIGTNNPTRKLDVVGGQTKSDGFILGTSNNIYTPGCIYTDSNWGMLFRGAVETPGIADFVFNNYAGTNMMVIKGGNVGIGTTNPLHSLQINGNCLAKEIRVHYTPYPSTFPGGDGGDSDGVFHRPDGQVYITADDQFYIRDNVDTTANRRHYFDTNTGNIRMEGNIATQALDYAELFEWYDGNPSGEDRVGYTVTLVEGTNKIKKMEVGDTPLGVVSAAPGVVGGQGLHWHGYWEKDDWGRPVYAQQLIRGEPVFNEDGTPKMKRVKNPDYDVTLEESYLPRDKRQEWSYIGLLGQVYIRKECVKSPYWRKIKDVDDVKELWLINTVLPDQNDKERILELETQLGSVLARLDTLENA
jgi:hypothetical protein